MRPNGPQLVHFSMPPSWENWRLITQLLCAPNGSSNFAVTSAYQTIIYQGLLDLRVRFRVGEPEHHADEV